MMISRLVVLSALAGLALACPRDPQEVAGVPGPESPELDARLAGYVVMDRPVGGLVAISLATSEERILRPQGQDSGTIHSVSGPDASGRVAFVENHMVAERHLLKTITLEGKDEQVVFEREGDALWSHNGDEIGDHLALSPEGGLAAFVENLERIQMRKPSALLGRGQLAIWDVAAGAPVQVEVRALDFPLAWLPGGRKLAYADLVPREAGLELLQSHAETDGTFGQEFAQWEAIPALFVYDLDTRTARAVHVGTRAAATPDGRALAVVGFEPAWRLCALEGQGCRGLLAPGNMGAIAFVEPNLLLYRAPHTEGAELRWTEHNSPLVGPKPMRSLKVADIDTGQFRSVVPYVDPRTSISFGRVRLGEGR